MKVTLRIVIDNTMSPALARELDGLCQSNTPTWNVVHNTKLPGVEGSTPDPAWVAKLREIDPDCQWLVISHDYGQNDSKDTDRLPMVCKAHDIPYIVVSNTIIRTSEQKGAIAEVFKNFPDDIVKACHTLIGKRRPHVKLAQQTLKGGKISYHLRVGPDPIERYNQRQHEPSPIAIIDASVSVLPPPPADASDPQKPVNLPT